MHDISTLLQTLSPPKRHYPYQNQLNIHSQDPELAKKLTQQLQCTTSDDHPLLLDADQMVLQYQQQTFQVELSYDQRFSSPRALRSHPLVQSALKHLPKTPIIIDTTAGVLQDSMLFYMLGYPVIALERCPLIFYMVKHALSTSGIEDIQLYHRDAIDALPLLKNHIDLLLIDAMFISNHPTAKPKKPMQLCRFLVGEDEDQGALIATALAGDIRHIIIKCRRADIGQLPQPPTSITTLNAKLCLAHYLR